MIGRHWARSAAGLASPAPHLTFPAQLTQTLHRLDSVRVSFAPSDQERPATVAVVALRPFTRSDSNSSHARHGRSQR
jgi:hypothetical protein